MRASTNAFNVDAWRLNGAGKIFSTGLLRTSSLIPHRDGPVRFHRLAARRSARRKRALMLTPLIVGALVLTVGHGREAISRASREKVIAVLRDPLSLFADRSPGARRPGALFASKAKVVPHERVLSTARDRPQSADMPPAADSPILSAAPPVFESGPGSPPPGIPPAFGPPFSDMPFLYPGPPPGGVPPGGAPPVGIPPSGTPPGGTPPGETPPSPPPEPPPIPVPEPATWTMVILGLLAAGAAMHAARQSR